MVIVAAASVASYLRYRSQQFLARARHYAQMEMSCRSNTIRPYLHANLESDVDLLARDCAELKERYPLPKPEK